MTWQGAPGASKQQAVANAVITPGRSSLMMRSFLTNASTKLSSGKQCRTHAFPTKSAWRKKYKIEKYHVHVIRDVAAVYCTMVWDECSLSLEQKHGDEENAIQALKGSVWGNSEAPIWIL